MIIIKLKFIFKYSISILYYKMHFCSKCQNMYYISIDPNNANKLVYYCRNCGNVDETLSVDNVTVSKIQLKKSEQEFSHIINKYTKLDPTLPRVNTILCPNQNCSTNTDDVAKEIIYIRYDDTNMKYVYLCSTCDTVWKTEDNK
jgi:DNA-directed RNA polymerase subunit M/transcription elongation factor TFIIS